jgi:hypothetical protein
METKAQHVDVVICVNSRWSCENCPQSWQSHMTPSSTSCMTCFSTRKCQHKWCQSV